MKIRSKFGGFVKKSNGLTPLLKLLGIKEFDRQYKLLHRRTNISGPVAQWNESNWLRTSRSGVRIPPGPQGK